MSLDPLTTIVWSSTLVYKFPIRNATIVGSTVTVKQINHQLSSGDVIQIAGASEFSELFSVAAVITVLDSNNFSYPVASPPVIETVTPTPGQKTDLWVSCKKYSTMLNYPGRLQFLLAGGHEAEIQTFESGVWTTQVTCKAIDGVTDVFFEARWKDARLALTVGSTIPTVTAYHAASPPPTTPADTTYRLPIFVGGGGGTLDPVGIPGTYDIVTTNEFGQVVAGSTGGGNDNNIYVTMLNSSGVTIPKGSPVRKTGELTIALAQGDSTKKGVFGIAYETILNGQTKIVLIEGIMTLPTGDWDLITGGTGGLVNDDIPYFLDFSVLGHLQKTVNVDTAPANSYLVAVGYAINANTLKIDIDSPIKVS